MALSTYTVKPTNTDALTRMGLASITSFVIFMEPLHVVERRRAFDKTTIFCNGLINN